MREEGSKGAFKRKVSFSGESEKPRDSRLTTPLRVEWFCVALGLKRFERSLRQEASQESCFARTHGRRGARTAANGIPYQLAVRAFCAEKDCDLFSSCSLPSKIYRFPCYAISTSGDRAWVLYVVVLVEDSGWGLPYWRIGVCSKTLREVKA